MIKKIQASWAFSADPSNPIYRDCEFNIEGGKIKSLESNKSSDKNDFTLDLRDYFLIPGMIDCHVHLISDIDWAVEAGASFPERAIGNAVARGLKNAETLLRRGVVACRDVGAWRALNLCVHDAVREKLIQGAEVICSGRSICARGGHSIGTSIEIDSPDQMRGAVRQCVRDGAQCIKIMMSGGVNDPGPEPGPCELTAEEMYIGVETARAMGRKVAVHAHGDTSIKIAVEAGCDSIEHGVFMSDSTMQLLKDKKTTYVPTLCAPYYAVMEGIKEEPDNPDHKKSQSILQMHRDRVKACHDLGIKIAMGSDAGCPFNPFDTITYELILMEQAGMSSESVLTAATRNAAELVGLDHLGSLNIGKEASFVVLKDNPIDNLETVLNPVAVIKSGEVVYGAHNLRKG